jgi:Zn-dependent protease with chaperone function
LYGVAAVNTLGMPTIFVSEEFFELSAFVQEFVLYHELGHVHLGHIQKPTFKSNVKGYFRNSVRSVSPHFGHVDEKELEADRFAAEQMGSVGRSMMALGWIMEDSIKKFGRGAHVKEMKLRINALLQGGKN